MRSVQIAAFMVAFGAAPAAWGLSPMTFAEAQRDKHVSIEIVDIGTGGLEVRVANHGAFTVQIEDAPGVVLDNPEPSEQDLTLVAPVSLTVPAGKTVSIVVDSYCLRSELHVPKRGRRFHAKGYDVVVRASVSELPANDHLGAQRRVWEIMDERYRHYGWRRRW